MSLLTIAASYPSTSDPVRGIFIHVLMRSLRALGVELEVIAPQSQWDRLRHGRRERGVPAGEHMDGVRVHRPRFLSFSDKKLLPGISSLRWTVSNYTRAVLRDLEQIESPPQLCYSLFLYPSGYAASRAARSLGVPAILELGESRYGLYESAYDVREISTLLGEFACIIAVSEAIQERCIERYGVSPEKIAVFPNGFDDSLFYPRDRRLMREKHGIPMDRTIIAFVGHFDSNKGPQRVLQAMRAHPEVGAVFVGSGPLEPEGSQVLFCGPVPHHQVAEWLNAADMFVLPTQSESCSIAILEALGCGLPVISSNLPFNYPALDPSVAFLVDPLDVGALAQAIGTLADDPERRKAMGQAAVDRARSFRILDRARAMLEWLSTQLSIDLGSHATAGMPPAEGTLPRGAL